MSSKRPRSELLKENEEREIAMLALENQLNELKKQLHLSSGSAMTPVLMQTKPQFCQQISTLKTRENRARLLDVARIEYHAWRGNKRCSSF
jgi:hypothetical protein